MDAYEQQKLEILQAEYRRTGRTLKGKAAENLLRQYGFAGSGRKRSKTRMTKPEIQGLVMDAFAVGLKAGVRIGEGRFGEEDSTGKFTPKVDSVLKEFGGLVGLYGHCGGGPAIERIGLELLARKRK